MRVLWWRLGLGLSCVPLSTGIVIGIISPGTLPAIAAENIAADNIAAPSQPSAQASPRNLINRDPASPSSDFLQPVPPPAPLPPDTPTLEPAPTPEPPSPATPNAIQVQVERIEVLGSTIFQTNDFAAIIDPLQGRSLSFDELRSAADAITQLYLDRGYITSRAVLVDQEITNGIVQIRVVEGSLESIEIEGNRRVHAAYIRSRIRLGARTPLNQASLEDHLRLLRLDPLFENVEASLRAGQGLGQSILSVRVTEADPWSANVSFDNFSNPSVGSERLGASIRYANLTGNGDSLAAAYFRTISGGSNQFDFSYQIPVNPMNGTVLLRFSPDSYRITDDDFDDIDIHGNSQTYEVSFRQPLVRSPRQEFALSLGFTHRDGESFVSDLTIDRSTTSIFRFEQDYTKRDPRGAWALRSQFNFGTSLLDATGDRNPDGEFFSWLGQSQRVQILDRNNLLITQLDLQLTPDALLPSQQLIIGGGQSLRGYRQNARSGDNGFRFSVEDRLTLKRNAAGASTLQVIPFIDAGAVWNSGRNPSPTVKENFLLGAGVGLLWQPTEQLTLRVDYAVPIRETSDRADNLQDDGIFFSVNYRF
jgi:hemolysin activation/secretion protein